VVVPALNEAERIEETLSGVPAWVDHVVVVDDASSDDTAALAGRGRDPRVDVVRHVENRGVGASIVEGYRRARAAGAGVVAVMAGDGQMDPADLEHVVRPVARGQADYVKGSRLSSFAALRTMPLHRAAANRVLGALTSLATGVRPVRDGQCGYTAIAGDAIDRLEHSLAREGLASPGRGLDALWRGFGYPNDLLAAVARAGLRVVEVPVRAVYRGERSGIRPWHLLPIAWLVARAALRRARSGALPDPIHSRAPAPAVRSRAPEESRAPSR